MQKYISLLRSVNMAGHNLIRMTELIDLFVRLGYNDAKSFIQSGNVIFSYGGTKSDSAISNEIETAIQNRFNLKVAVTIRTREELIQLISSNPYLSEPEFDPSRMAIIFLTDIATETQIQKLSNVDFPPDKFKITGRDIFVFCPNGFGKTKLYTGFFEKKMGVIGTARNWKTISTLINMCAT